MAVVSARGARVSYSRTRAGAPVLLIQGVSAIGDVWRPQVEALKQWPTMRSRFSSTFPDGKSEAHLTWNNLWTGIRSVIGTKRSRRNAFMSLVVSKRGMRENRQRLAEEMQVLFGRDLSQQPSIIRRQLRAMSRFDPTWRLRCLAATRTLVVTGKEDRIALPEHGRKLASAIPGAMYLELENAGHAMPIESAALINRLLAEHMAEVGHLSATRKQG